MLPRKRVLILVSVMLALSLVFCSSVYAGPKKVVDFWHSEVDPATVQAVDEIISDFEALHPDIKVNQVPLSWSAYDPKLMSALAVGSPPDLGFGRWGGFMANFQRMGLLRPLDDVVKAMGEEDILDAVKSFGVFEDGHWYGICHSVGSQIVLYRKDLFKEKGLTVPTTWEEFLRCAAALTEDTNGDGRVDRWALDLPGTGDFIMIMMTSLLGSNGGRFFDEKNAPALTEKQMIESLNFYKDLSKYTSPGWLGHGYLDTFSSLATGKVAMLYEGFGRGTQYIEKYAPEGMRDPEHFAAMDFPIGPSGTEGIGLFDAEPYLIFKNADYPEEAAEFLKFLFEKENIIKYYHSVPTHLFPIRHSVSKDPEYLAHPKIKKWRQWIDTDLKILRENRVRPGGCTEWEDVKEIPFIMQFAHSPIIGDMVGEVIEEDVPPEEAATSAQKRVKELIENFYRGAAK